MVSPRTAWKLELWAVSCPSTSPGRTPSVHRKIAQTSLAAACFAKAHNNRIDAAGRVIVQNHQIAAGSVMVSRNYNPPADSMILLWNYRAAFGGKVVAQTVAVGSRGLRWRVRRAQQ